MRNPMPDPERRYYTRQLQLSEIGEEGQQKLTQARVLVIGAGGLGCPALQYLAAAGVGTIGICEDDHVSIDNLHRQILYRFDDQQEPKLACAIEELSSLNPFVKTIPHPEKISPDNAETLFSKYDLVLDCTDNFPARFLINDAAVLTKTPLLQASIYQFEGELHGYHPHHQTACLRCMWPEMPEPGCIGNCAETGTVGAVTGVIGSLQALQAIYFLLDRPSILISGDWLSIDLSDLNIRKLARIPNPDCPVCGNTPSIVHLQPERYENAPSSISFEISATDLKTLKPHQLIDIRTAFERQIAPLPEALPLAGYNKSDFDPETPVVLICQSGQRSLALARQWRTEGRGNVYSLTGGLNAWKEISWTPTPAC